MFTVVWTYSTVGWYVLQLEIISAEFSAWEQGATELKTSSVRVMVGQAVTGSHVVLKGRVRGVFTEGWPVRDERIFWEKVEVWRVSSD